MTAGEIAMMAAVLVVAIGHGALAGALRGKSSVPLAVRVLLFVVAGVAVLGGLLATVIGLLLAFRAVSTADASMKASLLAQGISEAMNGTVLGIVYVIAFGLGVVAGELMTRRPPARREPDAPPA
jgi:hypothetical protein